jgi:tetratricopeptide (TPR) repeat protein
MANHRAFHLLPMAAVLLLGACSSLPTIEAETMTTEPKGASSNATELPDWRSMWDFSDPAGSAEKFRAAMAAGEAAGNEDYVLIVKTQLGRTEGLQRNFEGAHAILDTIEPKLDGASVELKMRYLLERGRAINSGGDPAASAPLFEEAWSMGQGAGLDHITADAGHMLGIVLKGDEALVWANRTMAFCEATDDERCKGWLGPLYNNTGWTYHDMGEYDKTLELWQKGVAYHEAKQSGEPLFIARWTVGRCYRSMGRFEEALASQQQLMADRKAAGSSNDAYVAEEIGECLLALARGDEAKRYFAKAYEKLHTDEWLAANEPERLARLKELGGM